MRVCIPASPGELVDKLTILEIKTEQITDPAKLVQVRREQNELGDIHCREIPDSKELSRLTVELKTINKRLWVIEDKIREHERQQRFDADFISLARSVYRFNDERSRAKAAIDRLLNAETTEVKSYAAY